MRREQRFSSSIVQVSLSRLRETTLDQRDLWIVGRGFPSSSLTKNSLHDRPVGCSFKMVHPKYSNLSILLGTHEKLAREQITIVDHLKKYE